MCICRASRHPEAASLTFGPMEAAPAPRRCLRWGPRCGRPSRVLLHGGACWHARWRHLLWTLALFCVMPGSLATIAGSVNAPPSQPSAGFDCGTDVSLDFEARACSTGSPLQNNLGGHGPDSGTPELRYGQVGELNGQPFDLVITNTTEYQPKDAGKTGCSGAFGHWLARGYS